MPFPAGSRHSVEKNQQRPVDRSIGKTRKRQAPHVEFNLVQRAEFHDVLMFILIHNRETEPSIQPLCVVLLQTYDGPYHQIQQSLTISLRSIRFTGRSRVHGILWPRMLRVTPAVLATHCGINLTPES